MASGKKNYFRHSMNARNDHKLRSFMELFGRNWREGYFYFFSLLELCGSEAQEGKTEHTFHKKTLRDLWGTSTQGVQDVCMKCAQSALVMCTVSADHVTFSLPNLLNYTGHYEKNAPNKEKKINKEKKEEKITPEVAVSVPEISEPEKNLPEIEPLNFRNPQDLNPSLFAVESPSLEEDVTLSDLARNVITAINSICGRSFRPVRGNMKHINARINEGYSFEDFVAVLKFMQEKWGNDPKMSAYLRPETIFGNKFDGYLQESKNALKPKIDPLDAFLESQGIVPTFNKGESA